MSGQASTFSFRGARCALGLAALAGLLAAPAASAFEYFDGRLQVNGFVEEQIRTIARDMEASDNWDLTQWYNVLDVEIEADLLPDGWGPIDVASAFVRIEARYDCIWNSGCEMFPNSVNVYGDNPKKFPKRYSDGRYSGYTGAVFTGDHRLIHGIPIPELGFPYKDTPHSGTQKPAYIWHVPGVNTLFGVPGADGTLGTPDDPAFYTFAKYVQPDELYRFGLRRVKGSQGGWDLQVLGPWEPRNQIDPIGPMADRVNPFNSAEANPITGISGSTALPYRPAPLLLAGTGNNGNRRSDPRGLYIPNNGVRRLLDRNAFDQFDQNFSEEELAWNHGASQQDEKELKEAYLDLEFFDSRLWIRAGKQSIVWGKTELFRTTDQFNPQDLALASLPSLEESRISLWSARAVWSFYTVGPFEDVRLEGAFNFDQFEPADIGRCGEPYTPYPACDKTAGLFAHGVAGFGLAGEVRPDNPWNDVKGLEAGARLEFRWDRFSFALTDFYGYDDFPYTDPVFYYERNVDPRTGRPRRNDSRKGCDPDGLYDGDTSGCLGSGTDALYNSSANQQRFAVICSSSVGFNDLDLSVCAQSVYNSPATTLLPFASIAETLGYILTGTPQSQALVSAQLTPGAAFPSVPLNHDIADGPGQGFFASFDQSLGSVLSDEQEALLGCGPYWGTSCDVSTAAAYGGIDLLNAELSALMQSWVGFPGTKGARWNTNDTTTLQPGTLGFVGGGVASRYERNRRYTLPGARSPFPSETDLDPSGWNAAQDGCVSSAFANCAGANELTHPFTGVYFKSEMAALSWNMELELAALSGLGKPDVACGPGDDPTTCRQIDEFVSSQSMATDRCSYVKPQLCSNVQALYAVAHTTRRSVRAGGNGHFGRTDFDWHVAGSGVLHYEKRNVLGFAMDFAEDRTKSTWSLEATWIGKVPFEDQDQSDGFTRASTYNLTISVDRPTFINFLNADRTFFINTQWFFRYISGWQDSFVENGPLNVLATLHVETGYYRDRLLPAFTLVYDFNSKSGAMIPEIAYRFTEAFSATIQVSWFWGRFEPIKAPLKQISDPPYRAGHRAYRDWTEQGVSPIRDRDEVSLVLRYTF